MSDLSELLPCPLCGSEAVKTVSPSMLPDRLDKSGWVLTAIQCSHPENHLPHGFGCWAEAHELDQSLIDSDLTEKWNSLPRSKPALSKG